MGVGYDTVSSAMLGEIAQVAAAAHAPFITGAAPSLMQMDSWQELANPRDLTKIFQTADYAPWLAPTHLAPLDGPVKTLADEITTGKNTVLAKARAIYDWTCDNTYRNPETRGCGAGDVLVCGGGTHNADLLGRLRACLPGITVESTLVKGLDPDWVEAVLFAWLARERLAGREQDTRAITGAQQPVRPGSVSPRAPPKATRPGGRRC